MNDKKQERWIYAVALLIPVVWLALLTAPCLGGTIIDVMKRLTEAIKSPLHIVWCENSLKCILVFLGLYAFGILLCLGSRGNTRDGEEHGSAKWGTPKELNKQLKQKTNFPLSKEIRLGMDTHTTIAFFRLYSNSGWLNSALLSSFFMSFSYIKALKALFA